VAVPFLLGMVEYLPRRFIETEATPPKPMLEWAKDPSKFAVLDISDDYRMMFHAAIHGKPMTGGNLTRIPDRLEKWYWGLPIVQALRHPGTFRVQPVLERDRRPHRLQLAAAGRRTQDALRRLPHQWTGAVEVPREGEWTFFLTSDDGSTLDVEGKRVVENGGAHRCRSAAGR
jgi:hypothetical protein